MNTISVAAVETANTKSTRKPLRLTKFKPALILLPFALLFFMFQIAPMLWVLFNSFIYEDEFSLENYQEIFDSAFILQGFSNSLWLAVTSSLIAIIIAALFVSSLRRFDSRARDLIVSFTNMTANFSGVPLAFAFIIILGFNGALTLLLKKYGIIDDFNLYGQWGLLAIYIYFQVPLATLLLYPAFDALSDDWQAASSLLGANNWQFWRYIGLPVLSPALLGTFIILIANAMGAYASIYALTSGNYNVITVRIASLVSGDIFLEPNLAAAISVLLILLLAFITLINQLLISRSYHAKR
ncbi:ABC transporter permease subunit [Moritella marina ATCC 15381]|uniref:ABC transporter permease subunit n=1 Tax=Moritella marina ATCC 15381 TaxID=1202962 RepID=A0A5J6WT48_MORMI|nr:ABC transporter permease subunit [Moritella marina]QFI39980.1 ABC transporter permease subunit [Moritella marina ATCC 15381]